MNFDGNIPVSDEEKELFSRGWEKQFSCSLQRLDEMIELYKSLGNEVILTDVQSDSPMISPDCRTCIQSCAENLKIIWTRKVNSATKKQIP